MASKAEMIIRATENVNRAETEMIMDEVESHLLGKMITTTYQDIFELRLGGMLFIIVLNICPWKVFKTLTKIYFRTYIDKLVENIVKGE